MSNSENDEDILSEHLYKFERYVLEMNASIYNYCNFYKMVEKSNNLFEKCKNSLTNDEKNDFDNFMNDLMCFNLSFSEIQSKCDESNQAFQFIICQYQERIKSLINQNQELRLKIKSNQEEIEEADYVISKYDEIDQVQHEKPYKDHQFEQVLEQNSSLQKEIEDLKNLISDQQRKKRHYERKLKETISLNYERKLKEIKESFNRDVAYQNELIHQLSFEISDKDKSIQQLTNENSSLKSELVLLLSKQKSMNTSIQESLTTKELKIKKLYESNKSLIQKNTNYDQKIKELVDYNEILKQTMKNKENALNNENNELKQKFDNASKQYQQILDAYKSIREISEGQEPEIERLIGENKKLENKYNDLQRVGNQQLDELTRTNESLNKTIASQNERINQLIGENKSIKREISSKGKRIQQLTNENSSFENEILSKEKAIQKLINENNLLHKEIENKEEENNFLKKEIVDKDKKIKDTIHPIKNFTSAEIANLVKGKRLGRGSTSEVFEVFLQEKIALKVFDTEIIGKEEHDENDDDDECNIEIDIEKFKKFLCECEILNQLNHPNIIKTLGFFFGDSTHEPAILLEYCESNLKKRIKKLSNEERISAIVNLSSAMDKVHSMGIIHRDLKPENILLDSNNNIKLCDFGLCTFINDEIKSRTSMVGSLQFMSPELLQGRKDYDQKVDVYAFGVVVFIILTKGEYPDISIAEVANGKQAHIPSNISSFSSQLIRDCWSSKPKDRPSFSEICDRLKGNEQKLI